jgi:hypothetical protein
MRLAEPKTELSSKGALGLQTRDARSAIFTEGRREMLRKMLFTLTAVVALGAASTAMAMHGGGGGGGGGIHGGGGGWGGGPGLSGARPGRYGAHDNERRACHADDARNDDCTNHRGAGSGLGRPNCIEP